MKGMLEKEGMAAMKRNNRRNRAGKERIIMIASSAFVLTALTMTGIYMKSADRDLEDDGYSIDFTALENGTENKIENQIGNGIEDKIQEIARGNGTGGEQILDEGLLDFGSLEDDLDYMPMEAGSGLVEIPGLTDWENPEVQEEIPAELPADEPKKQETGAQPVVKELHFAEGEGLLRPLEGETLIPYSMDGSVYFSTLDQYKYNPALMIEAETGTAVRSCADGRVIDIFETEEIGHAVTVELGDGYQLTYGQLEGLNVTLNSYISEGDEIAVVAAPTKYYCVEGSNLYLKLTVDGAPVNPEALFR